MPITTHPHAAETHHANGAGETGKAAVAQRVIVLLDRLGRLTRELQFANGLNPAQWEALRFIAQANKLSRTPSALAEYLGATKGTVSQTLIALENKGLITRCKKTCDRRQVELCLTEAGQAMLAKDPMQTLQRAAAAMADELGPHLVKGLTRLLHDLQNRHQLLEFGVCQDCSLFCVSTLQSAAGECGATGEAITTTESKKICVNYKAAG
jgi:DNA-binding MarR family transcriptional regulator